MESDYLDVVWAIHLACEDFSNFGEFATLAWDEVALASCLSIPYVKSDCNISTHLLIMLSYTTSLEIHTLYGIMYIKEKIYIFLNEEMYLILIFYE